MSSNCSSRNIEANTAADDGMRVTHSPVPSPKLHRTKEEAAAEVEAEAEAETEAEEETEAEAEVEAEVELAIVCDPNANVSDPREAQGNAYIRFHTRGFIDRKDFFAYL